MTDWKDKAQQAGIDASTTMSRLVNSFGSDGGDAFIKAMSCEHRTLQQNFTRLIFKWLELVASDEYKIDERNEASKMIAKRLLEGFIKETAKECKISEEQCREQLFYKLPSKWLPVV